MNASITGAAFLSVSLGATPAQAATSQKLDAKPESKLDKLKTDALHFLAQPEGKATVISAGAAGVVLVAAKARAGSSSPSSSSTSPRASSEVDSAESNAAETSPAASTTPGNGQVEAPSTGTGTRPDTSSVDVIIATTEAAADSTKESSPSPAAASPPAISPNKDTPTKSVGARPASSVVTASKEDPVSKMAAAAAELAAAAAAEAPKVAKIAADQALKLQGAAVSAADDIERCVMCV